jgi:hypothetical protein
VTQAPATSDTMISRAPTGAIRSENTHRTARPARAPRIGM